MWTAREREQYLSATASFLTGRHGFSEREAWRLIQKAGLPAQIRRDTEETIRLSPKARAEIIAEKYECS
jgi:hypothetical protein